MNNTEKTYKEEKAYVVWADSTWDWEAHPQIARLTLDKEDAYEYATRENTLQDALDEQAGRCKTCEENDFRPLMNCIPQCFVDDGHDGCANCQFSGKEYFYSVQELPLIVVE